MKKTKHIFWTIFSISFGIFLAFIILEKMGPFIQKDDQGISARAINSIASTEEEEIPKYYFARETKEEPRVSAEAYLVGDLDTGEIILAKNEQKQFPIASVTKFVTGYVANELLREGDIAKISKKALATYGKNGNFHVGEKIEVSELLYPLLLESSNDAAEVLAEHFDREIFIEKMNQVAEILDLSYTSFDDPSGLSANNKSTPFEIFKLAAYVKQKAGSIFEITTKRSYSNNIHNWSSHNQFLKEEGYIGGKSGFTNPARQTVVSLFSLPLAEEDTRDIAITLLRSQDRYTDVKNILSYLKRNIYYGGKKDATLAWVKEKAGTPDIKDPGYVSLLFAGDMMLDRGVKSSVMKNFNGDYASLFEKLDILKKSDITFANLEGPASDQGKDRKNLYSFRMHPTVIPALKGAGINIVSVANNHAGDWGHAAFADTLKLLDENEVSYIGGGTTKTQAEEPLIIEKYGMKIGFLGFSDVGPDWMSATETQSGILLAKDPRFGEIIKNASEKVDHLIVSFHFGDEYKTIHNSRQEHLAHTAVDNGAKIVIGHHPHVIQDTEVYKDSFIAYSLGNFIFDQGFSENTMQGMLLELKLSRDGSISTKKNIVKLSKQFMPEKVILGKEEKVKFEISE